MKSFFCKLSEKRLSAFGLMLAALVLAVLMIFTDADPVICFVALLALNTMTEKKRPCRLFRRTEN